MTSWIGFQITAVDMRCSGPSMYRCVVSTLVFPAGVSINTYADLLGVEGRDFEVLVSKPPVIDDFNSALSQHSKDAMATASSSNQSALRRP